MEFTKFTLILVLVFYSLIVTLIAFFYRGAFNESRKHFIDIKRENKDLTMQIKSTNNSLSISHQRTRELLRIISKIQGKKSVIPV